MKIAIIGGGGVRGPLLVRGMTSRNAGLRAAHVALYDPDAGKIALLNPIYRALLDRADKPFELTIAGSLEEAVEGAHFVIVSIRAGGMAARSADERMLLDRGLLGQETVGAAGFAKALRTIPPMLRIAAAVRERAPHAWIVNFTNPVGIVTEAITKSGPARIIGICDTPCELYEGVAQALQTPLDRLHCDYFGLNHLGWVKSVTRDGEDCLPSLLRDGAAIQAVYRHPLFETGRIQALGALPSEYLYYYYRSETAVANLRQAGTSRAEAIEVMNQQLWDELARADRPLDVYERYLESRNSTYMSGETAAGPPLSREELYAGAAGYDRIALAVMCAMAGNTGAVVPVDLPNRGAIETLEDTDVVEVPCVLGANGPLPLAAGKPPSAVSPLLHQVKHYERLTVRAALTASAKNAVQALAANPLINDRDLASDLVDTFRATHRELLAYLK